MSIDKSKLEAVLSEESLLLDEKRMWFRIGFFISAGTKYDSRLGTNRGTLIDGAGNETLIAPMIAKNLRNSIIDWWQGEKIKPRSDELKDRQTEVGPYDELENRNTT